MLNCKQFFDLLGLLGDDIPLFLYLFSLCFQLSIRLRKVFGRIGNVVFRSFGFHELPDENADIWLRSLIFVQTLIPVSKQIIHLVPPHSYRYERRGFHEINQPFDGIFFSRLKNPGTHDTSDTRNENKARSISKFMPIPRTQVIRKSMSASV